MLLCRSRFAVASFVPSLLQSDMSHGIANYNLSSLAVLCWEMFVITTKTEWRMRLSAAHSIFTLAQKDLIHPRRSGSRIALVSEMASFKGVPCRAQPCLAPAISTLPTKVIQSADRPYRWMGRQPRGIGNRPSEIDQSPLLASTRDDDDRNRIRNGVGRSEVTFLLVLPPLLPLARSWRIIRGTAEVVRGESSRRLCPRTHTHSLSLSLT